MSDERRKYTKVSYDEMFTELKNYLRKRSINYPELKGRKISCSELGRNTKYLWSQYRDNTRFREKLDEINSIMEANLNIYEIFDGAIPEKVPEILNVKDFLDAYYEDREVLEEKIRESLQNLIGTLKDNFEESLAYETKDNPSAAQLKNVLSLKTELESLSEDTNKRINELSCKIDNLADEVKNEHNC